MKAQEVCRCVALGMRSALGLAGGYCVHRWSPGGAFGGSGTVVLGAASAPWCPSCAGAGNTSHKTFHKTVLGQAIAYGPPGGVCH